MCWGVPGKIIKIDGNTAKVDIGGVVKEVALDLLKSPKKGKYVIVHAGYAIQEVEEKKAKFTIDFFKGKNRDVKISG
jgi:hydrogenase expression/formation protein HypC